MESGEDKDETRAARMDGWVAWEHEVREEGGYLILLSLLSLIVHILSRGGGGGGGGPIHTPRFAHSARWVRRGPFCDRKARPHGRICVLAYISLMDEGLLNEKSSSESTLGYHT
jgi:hypothetical protein